MDLIVDGCWGFTAGSASLAYLLQRYEFRGETRVKIFLYSSDTSMNSLCKLTHQIDAELQGFHLAVKTISKCITTLQEEGVKLEGGPRLISEFTNMFVVDVKTLVYPGLKHFVDCVKSSGNIHT